MAVNDLFDQPVNQTDPAGFFFNYPNELTGGMYGIGILMTVYIIVFGSLIRFGIDRAAAASAMVGFITTLILTTLGVVGGEVFTVSVVILILTILLSGGRNR